MKNCFALLAACLLLSACFSSSTPLIPETALVLPLPKEAQIVLFNQDSKDPTRWNAEEEMVKNRPYRVLAHGNRYAVSPPAGGQLANMAFAPLNAERGWFVIQFRFLSKDDGKKDKEIYYHYGIASLSGDKLFLSFPRMEDMPEALRAKYECKPASGAIPSSCRALRSYAEVTEVLGSVASPRFNSYLQLRAEAPAAGSFEEGKAALQRGDYQRAIALLQPLADRGHADAQTVLAMMYWDGRGVGKSPSEAARWFRRAAEQGNADAQTMLGSLYLNGQGVERNYAESLKWYRKAADQGNLLAFTGLGGMYLQGNGVTRDHDEAVKWYRRAADRGYAPAQFALGLAYRLKSAKRASGPLGLNRLAPSEDDEQAAGWFRKAAEQNHAGAQYELGDMYAMGEGVAKNRDEALKWLRLAATQGNPNARKRLEELGVR